MFKTNKLINNREKNIQTNYFGQNNSGKRGASINILKYSFKSIIAILVL